MPLPWLIGIAAVAAATAVVKAVNNHESSSSHNSDDSDRRRQEEEANLKRKRDGLIAKRESLNNERLTEARKLLTLSIANLSSITINTEVLTSSDFENALSVKEQSNSAYALCLNKILKVSEDIQKDFNHKDRKEFLLNLKIFEALINPIDVIDDDLKNLALLQDFCIRIEKLQKLKSILEESE